MAMNHTGNVSSTANTNFHLATSNGESGGGSLELTQQLQHMKLSSMPKIPKRQPTIICEDIIDDDFGEDDDDEEEEDNLSLMGEPGDGGGAVGGGGDKVIRSASTASLTVPAVSDTDEKVEKRRPPLPTSQSDYNCAQ